MELSIKVAVSLSTTSLNPLESLIARPRDDNDAWRIPDTMSNLDIEGHGRRVHTKIVDSNRRVDLLLLLPSSSLCSVQIEKECINIESILTAQCRIVLSDATVALPPSLMTPLLLGDLP